MNGINIVRNLQILYFSKKKQNKKNKKMTEKTWLSIGIYIYYYFYSHAREVPLDITLSLHNFFGNMKSYLIIIFNYMDSIQKFRYSKLAIKTSERAR